MVDLHRKMASQNINSIIGFYIKAIEKLGSLPYMYLTRTFYWIFLSAHIVIFEQALRINCNWKFFKKGPDYYINLTKAKVKIQNILKNCF